MTYSLRVLRALLALNSMTLPNQVVCAETVNSFKNRLDKFWSDQEVLYDYKSDLHGIGNRSILV